MHLDEPDSEVELITHGVQLFLLLKKLALQGQVFVALFQVADASLQEQDTDPIVDCDKGEHY